MKNNLKNAHEFIMGVLTTDQRKSFSSYDHLLLATCGKFNLRKSQLIDYLNEIASTNKLYILLDRR